MTQSYEKFQFLANLNHCTNKDKIESYLTSTLEVIHQYIKVLRTLKNLATDLVGYKQRANLSGPTATSSRWCVKCEIGQTDCVASDLEAALEREEKAINDFNN
ncbi:hypothetical protein RB195_022032 [Necator americanus]|uniref:Uncharacterized protein n=1 Tax=Necator americanus TaxID=51031 RepID=A0ABR1EE03_NECAM